MEPHSSVAFPAEGNTEVIITGTSQGVGQISKDTAALTGLPQNRIVSRIKRLGGGFGGKGNSFTPILTSKNSY